MENERKLNSEELQVLSLTKQFHCRVLEKGFGWKNSLILLLFQILLGITAYYVDDSVLDALIKFGLIILLIILWGQIEDFRAKTKESKQVLKVIKRIEEKSIIKITRFLCSNAIFFPNHEDEGDCYALQIEDEKLLFWWDLDFSLKGILPNTQFEIINDEETAFILGNELLVSGEKFQPIKIDARIKWNHIGIFPAHREIVGFTIEEFLEKLGSSQPDF